MFIIGFLLMLLSLVVLLAILIDAIESDYLALVMLSIILSGFLISVDSIVSNHADYVKTKTIITNQYDKFIFENPVKIIKYEKDVSGVFARKDEYTYYEVFKYTGGQ